MKTDDVEEFSSTKNLGEMFKTDNLSNESFYKISREEVLELLSFSPLKLKFEMY